MVISTEVIGDVMVARGTRSTGAWMGGFLVRTPLPTESSGTAETWNFEEAQVFADEDDNVHAMWMGLDNMPYYSYSTDEAETWSNP